MSKRKRRRSVRKEIYSIILSFILMLTLMCLSFFIMGKYSMLSVHGVMNSCDRVKYYEDINTEMTTLAYEKGIPFGIKKKHIKNLFDDQKIKEDMTNVLIAQLKNEEYLVETDLIREKITENIVKEQGELDEKQKESLNAYLVEVSNMYKDKMTIPGSSYFTPIINLWTKVITIGIPIGILIASLCIFFLVSTTRMLHRGLRYIAYSILGAGVTLTTIFSASISNGFIYKFNISDVYMRKFYTFWIGHEMLMQVFVGIGLLLSGAIFIYIIMRQKSGRP